MLRLAANAEVANDLISLRIDDVHAVTAGVRHIDERWERTNNRTKVSGRVRGVDIALVQNGWHARQRGTGPIGALMRGEKQEQKLQHLGQAGHSAFETASAACLPMRMQSGMPMPV